MHNFYIQRLRNINNGTRGTTIGLPLFNNNTADDNYVLVADLALTSLTMTELQGQDELLDTTFMVVDRDSGEVLFHLDDDRALIENLFSTGQGSEDISHRIRAGLDGREWSRGYYHGVAGHFSTQKMVVGQWALVAFMPEESLNSYMTNIFLLISITMALFIIFIAFVIVGLRRCCDTGLWKQRLAIPLVIDRRKILVFSSVFISGMYLAYWLGSALERSSEGSPDATIWMFCAASAVLSLIWGYFEYIRLYQVSRQAQRAPINIHRGALWLIAGYIIGGASIVWYLQQVGMVSASSLNWYYSQKLYPARLNQESIELRKQALNQFPNSVVDKQVAPLSLLPISSNWADKLARQNINNDYIQPKDVMYFSTLVNTTDANSWASRYLLGPSQRSKTCSAEKPYKDNSLAAPETSTADCNVRSNKLYRPLSLGNVPFWWLFGYLAICVLWVMFNRRILAVRLFGSPQFLRHLNQIVNRAIPPTQHCPSGDLQIDLVDSPQSGLDLALAIQKWQANPQHPPSKLENLFSQCTMLTEVALLKNPLPNMKIDLVDSDGKLVLHMWDMEASLEDSVQRALLLRLLNQLKSLKMADQLSRISLFCGFHSFQRLCLKDSLRSNYQEQKDIRQHEYFSWAECLMDFSVRVPDDLQEHLDLDFIQHEINALPVLQFLNKELPQIARSPTSHFNLMRWIHLKNWQKSHSEWASINYILLKVEALYRFKWESCSAAEKLALYYLVQNKRINPTNVQMLEHLALNGLIKVIRGRIRIVNKSFAYFVKYAEDEETLQKLVEQGNVGNWQDYKMPITVLILMVIGTIAITSGSSLYMIVASAMGVLGTIGSLTNSTNLIRNNLEK